MSKYLDVEIRCDGCGELLFGRDRAAFRRKAYVQFRGQSLVHFANQRKRGDALVYLTQPGQRELNFCLKRRMPCIEQYIDGLIEGFYIRQEQDIQAETEYAGKR